MSLLETTNHSIERRIARAIQAEYEQIAEEEIAAGIVEITKKVERRIRQKTGAVVATLLESYSIEKRGETLHIQVDFKGTKHNPIT